MIHDTLTPEAFHEAHHHATLAVNNAASAVRYLENALRDARATEASALRALEEVKLLIREVAKRSTP